MKVVILGGTGLLGQALVKECRYRNYKNIAVAREKADVCFDITDDEALENLIKNSNPDVVINTVAIVNHKFCNENPREAYLVNSRPNSILANLSKIYNFKFVYISTDGYFCGDKDLKHCEDNCNIKLLNEYARTKFCGEIFSLTDKNTLVVRTNIVGFRHKKNSQTFVEWVVDCLRNNKDMTLFEDYYISSISVSQFSKILFDILAFNPTGIFNIASSEVFSKKDFIENLAIEFGYSLKNARIGKLSEFFSVQRADSLGLDVTKVECLLKYKLPTLKEVIIQLKKEFESV